MLSRSRRHFTGWTGRLLPDRPSDVGTGRRRRARRQSPSSRTVPIDGARPAPPVERIAELRRAYLGQDRRAGQGIRNSSPGDEAAVFRGAGFAGPELVVVPDGRTVVRSADDLVAETFSLSSTAPHLLGDRLPQFEADLRRVLAEASPDGAFGFVYPITSSRSGESRHRSHSLLRRAPAPGSISGRARRLTGRRLRLSVQSGLVKPPGEVVEGCPGGRAIAGHWL